MEILELQSVLRVLKEKDEKLAKSLEQLLLIFRIAIKKGGCWS